MDEFSTKRPRRAVKRIAAAAERIADALEKFVFSLGRPGPLRLIINSEKENEMFGFQVLFPEELDPTAVTRELSVKVGADDPVVVTFPPDVAGTPADFYHGRLSDAVHAELVDLDAANNRSLPSILDAVITDTIPPKQPGDLGIIINSETPDLP
jgi:hypothetical protein